MCNGGRIRHHLKHNLWRKNAHVLIVGYQTMGTPGRALVDGAKTFAISKEKIVVKATIHTLGGFSAHAGQSQLIDWFNNFSSRPRTYLVHGETEAKDSLQSMLTQQGWQVSVPELGETVSI
jgi:metallo-beta-lactamase family protein